MTVFRDISGEDFADRLRIFVAKRDACERCESTVCLEAYFRIAVFGKGERFDMLEGEELPIGDDTFLGDGALDGSGFALKGHIAHDSDENKGDGHDGAIGEEGVDDSCQKKSPAPYIE